MYAGEPELDILRALGYFDRPAEPEALKLVMPKIEERKYRAALKRLKDARLILTADPAQSLDCHPLVRELFSAEATREGHARLYEHYKKQAPERPDTLEEMTPLFYAVYHGCQAGLRQATLDDVYFGRIQRGDEAYMVHKLGAFGTTISLLANFFEPPWSQPAASLSSTNQAWVIGNAGFALHSVGRLAHAVEPMRAGAEARVRLEDWVNAAVGYNNLSDLSLTLGNIRDAVDAARESVDLADRSEVAFQRMARRSALAYTMHQSGEIGGAMRLFVEAERLKAEDGPECPLLSSLSGYRYCDLLLGQGQAGDVLRRASRTIGWVRNLLSIGLDHLSLGRVHPSGSAEAAHHIDQAVDFLRRAGTLDLLPLALLARGTPRDLDEVFRIASRSGMKLFLADYHLAMGNLAEAEALIVETGYHRRDAELAALRARKAGA